MGSFVSLLFFSGAMGILLLFAAFFGFSWYARKKVADFEGTQTETHNRFVFLLVNILVYMAKSDGHFTKSELQTMLNFFEHSLHYNQDQMYWAKQLIKEAKDSEQNLEELLTEFRTTFAYEPRLILLELVYQIIYSKKPVIEKELDQARKIALFLQINQYDQRTIEAKYRYGQTSGAPGGTAVSEERYYAVLGLQSGADFVTIKKSYRKLSMQYHPDKVAHLGDEFKQVAEEKMKEINAAYDYFKKKFNS